MQYININDLLTVIDQTTLNVVTGNNNALISAMEQNAVEEMTAYLSVRHDAQKIFSNPANLPKVVKMYLIDMILYHLHTRVSPDHIPELRAERYKNAINWLEKVADGFINPSLPVKNDKTTSTPLRYGSGKKQSHYY